MNNRIKVGIVWASAFWVGLSGFGANGTRAEESFRDTIVGKVTFQRRATVVPLAICEKGGVCPKSEPYWSLVLQKGATRYELNRVFAKGSDRAPDSVELAGVTIRSGAQLQMEGLMQAIAPRYLLVTEVLRASLVMDQAAMAPEWHTEWGAATMRLWRCVSSESPGLEDVRLVAEIWKTSRPEAGQSLSVQITAETPTVSQTLLSFQTSGVSGAGSLLTFSSSDREDPASLVIDQSKRVLADVPGELEFKRPSGSAFFPIKPILIRENMSCDQAAVIP